VIFSRAVLAAAWVVAGVDGPCAPLAAPSQAVATGTAMAHSRPTVPNRRTRRPTWKCHLLTDVW
jgi:hypothetical protein